MESIWCQVCGTRHDPPYRVCPGPLLATGDERAGWRVTVKTPSGLQVIGALVALCGNVWRARILTYPDFVWTVPDGGCSMKFAATSPQLAERQAIAFIKARCIERGWLRCEEVGPVTLGSFSLERAPDAAPPSPARRILRSFPIWYGLEVPTIEAVTCDLSTTGLFITTHDVFDAGVQIQMRLELYTFRVTFRGQVISSRGPADGERPPGMGVRLQDPPAKYVKYVETLR
jgi:hypothetical protein